MIKIELIFGKFKMSYLTYSWWQQFCTGFKQLVLSLISFLMVPKDTRPPSPMKIMVEINFSGPLSPVKFKDFTTCCWVTCLASRVQSILWFLSPMSPARLKFHRESICCQVSGLSGVAWSIIKWPTHTSGPSPHSNCNQVKGVVWLLEI